MEGHVSKECTAETKAKTCYKCGQEGHIVRPRPLSAAPAPLISFRARRQSRECPENANGGGGSYSAFNSSSSGTECYRCGKVGHIARACPEAPGGNTGYGGGGYGSFGGQQRTWYVCLSLSSSMFAQGSCSYTCGGVGHLSRDCVQGSKCYNCSGFVSPLTA